MTNTRSNIHHTKVLPLNLSDHDCAMCVRKINHQKMPFALDYIEQGLTTIIYRHVPKIEKRVKGGKCPWLTYEIKTLMNTRNKVLRKARKTNKKCDWLSYKRVKNLTIKSNKLRKNIKKTCYSKTGINLLSFGTASKKCFLQKNLYLSL